MSLPEPAVVDDDFLDPDMLDTMPGMLFFDAAGLRRQVEDLQRKLDDRDLMIDKVVAEEVKIAEKRIQAEAHNAKEKVRRLEKEIDKLTYKLKEARANHEAQVNHISRELSGGSQRLYVQALVAEQRWLRAYDMICFLLEKLSHSGLVHGCPDSVSANISMCIRKMMDVPPIPMFNQAPDKEYSPWQRLMKLFGLTPTGPIGEGKVAEDKE